MKKANVVIENETGLHARPATELAKLAMKYKCTINLIVNGKLIDARSPLMIMSAGIKYKTELEIICDGENEEGSGRGGKSGHPDAADSGSG